MENNNISNEETNCVVSDELKKMSLSKGNAGISHGVNNLFAPSPENGCGEEDNGSDEEHTILSKVCSSMCNGFRSSNFHSC